MFGFRKRLEEKRAKNKAISDSQHWKNHTQMRQCLQSMRGSCTVAPIDLHEAVITVVNIAQSEDTWTTLERLDIPADFLGSTIYIVWDNEKLPVLKAPWALAEENVTAVTAVAHKTFLVSETMDRILYFDGDGKIRLYDVR